jgi:hypothetical protein
MAKTLKIADGLELPITAVTEKLAFLGRTGSGKTYAAMKLAEQMILAGAQVVVLDAVGAWYGLRVASDGPGLEVPVCGGLHGDYPLESTGGKLLADLIVDRGISAVLDVSQFTHAEQTRFALDFATTFFQRKKAAPSAVHVFLEECQEFVPQNPSPGEAAMLGAFERLWKLGRNFGIGGSLISQRPQEINKKALNQTGTLVVFGMTGPQERKAIELWVSAQGVDEQIADILPTLKPGHPHVWSPVFLGVSKTVAIARKQTADVSSTPQVGKGAKAQPLTPIDGEQFRTAMAATVERAKADDPRELRKQLGERDKRIRELEKATTVVATLEQTKESKQPSLTDADRELLKTLSADFVTFSDDAAYRQVNALAAMADRAKTAIDEAAAKWIADAEKRRELFLQHLEKTRVQKILDKLERVPAPAAARQNWTKQDSSSPSLNTRRPAAVPRAVKIGGPAAAVGDAGLGHSGLRRMLIALAQRPQGLTRSQLGLRAQVSTSGGSFNTYLSKARVNGWVNTAGDRITVTDAGLDAVGSYEPLPEGEGLQAHYLREFGGSGAGRMLCALITAYPKALSRAELSDASNVDASGGSFNTYLSKLRTLELVEGRTELRASEELFS